MQSNVLGAKDSNYLTSWIKLCQGESLQILDYETNYQKMTEGNTNIYL